MSPVPALSLRSYTQDTRYLHQERKKETHLYSTFQLSPLKTNNLSPQGKKTLSSMAPITRLSTPLLRSLTQKRGFSIISRVRQTARSFEPHPFERMPITQKTAPADYGKLVKHVGDAAMLYVFLPMLLRLSLRWELEEYG
jgi:hypothetical protein